MTKKFILAAALVASVSYAANFNNTMTPDQVKAAIAAAAKRGESPAKLLKDAKAAGLNVEVVIAQMTTRFSPAVVAKAAKSIVDPVTISRAFLSASIKQNAIVAALKSAGYGSFIVNSAVKSAVEQTRVAAAPLNLNSLEATAAGNPTPNNAASPS